MAVPVKDSAPWYREPVMWLVVALPLLALVGGAVMVALTVVRPDVEIHSERLDSPAMVPAAQR